MSLHSAALFLNTLCELASTARLVSEVTTWPEDELKSSFCFCRSVLVQVLAIVCVWACVLACIFARVCVCLYVQYACFLDVVLLKLNMVKGSHSSK